MKRLFISLFIIIIASYFQPLIAQSSKKAIRGKVISFEESFPIEGVAVFVKGTTNTTGTQVDGTYSLELRSGDSVIVFSQTGYEIQEIRIKTDQSEYNIVLKSNTGLNVQSNATSKTFKYLPALTY